MQNVGKTLLINTSYTRILYSSTAAVASTSNPTLKSLTGFGQHHPIVLFSH